MLITEFLKINQFSDETYWLNSQASQVPHDCFGCAVEFESIDSRMTGFKPLSQTRRRERPDKASSCIAGIGICRSNSYAKSLGYPLGTGWGIWK
jgi:hypothetical protein